MEGEMHSGQSHCPGLSEIYKKRVTIVEHDAIAVSRNRTGPSNKRKTHRQDNYIYLTLTTPYQAQTRTTNVIQLWDTSTPAQTSRACGSSFTVTTST